MKKVLMRTLSWIITIGMLMSCCSVCATDSDGLKNAILIVKNRITIPQEFEFDSNFNTRDGITEYYLNWYDDNNSISVTVNSRGDITDLHYYTDESEDFSPKFTKYTDDELKNIAMENILKLNPTWESGLSLENARINSNSIYDTNTYVVIDRYVNGIPFLNDSVRASINNQTGMLRYLSATWTYKEKIPNPEQAINVELAMEEFFKLSPLELIYEKVGETAKAVYVPTNPWAKINARNGGSINEYYRFENGAAEETMADAEAPMMASGGANMKLSENELANISEIDGLLTEKELISKAQGLENTGLDSARHNYTRYNRRSYYSYNGKNEDKKAEYNATLGFIFNHGTDKEYSGSVTFDAKTGELLSYHAYDYIIYNKESNKESAINNEKAIKAADGFAKKYAAEYFEKTKAEINGGNNSDYGVLYTRYENEIPYKPNYVSVGVNSETGKISSFNKTWDDELGFETAEGLISMEDAKEAFKKWISFELSYALDYTSPDGKAELCYQTFAEDGYTIDAKTGEVVRETREETYSDYPTDISGHYAEKQIKALVDAGIITKCELYNPEAIITKGELTDLATSLKGNYGVDIARETKENLKIILPLESYEDEAPSQRADGIIYIIRALGYGEVAELSGIYNHGFTDDVPAEVAGYAALAKGLKIVRGDENGAFNSAAPLSKADAAIMIYNYLAR